MVDKSQLHFTTEKVYYCPKCARFLGVVRRKRPIVDEEYQEEPIERPRPIQKQIRREPGRILEVVIPEKIEPAKAIPIEVVVENQGDKSAQYNVFSKVITPGVRIIPHKRSSYVDPNKTYRFLFVMKTEEKLPPGISISFDLTTKDNKPLDSRILALQLATAEKPKVVLEAIKTVDRMEVEAGEQIAVAVAVKNVGSIESFVQIFDDVPYGTELVSGETSWEGEIKPGEKVILEYILRFPKDGVYHLPPARIIYFEGSDRKTLETEGISITVKSKLRPSLHVSRKLSRNVVRKGETLELTTIIKNSGYAVAEGVEYIEEIPDGFRILETGSLKKEDNRLIWRGKLKPKEKVKLRYRLKAEEEGDFEIWARCKSQNAGGYEGKLKVRVQA